MKYSAGTTNAMKNCANFFLTIAFILNMHNSLSAVFHAALTDQAKSETTFEYSFYRGTLCRSLAIVSMTREKVKMVIER